MKMERIYNNKGVKSLRKELRNNSTPAESAMWELLRAGRLDGTKWRRQYSIGKYIVDFYCPKARLCVELDGDTHFTMQGDLYDLERTEYINSLGISILRFENREIWDNPERVLLTIKDSLVLNNRTPQSLRDSSPTLREHLEGTINGVIKG
jgi:very-short-patch-repair endonuclease